MPLPRALVPCRYQKLRKKCGLTVTDIVDLYYELTPSTSAMGAAAADGADAPDGAATRAAGGGEANGEASSSGEGGTLLRVLGTHADYLRQTLGQVPRPLPGKPPGSDVIAQEETRVGSEDIVVVLAQPLTRAANGGAADATADALAKAAL